MRLTFPVSGAKGQTLSVHPRMKNHRSIAEWAIGDSDRDAANLIFHKLVPDQISHGISPGLNALRCVDKHRLPASYPGYRNRFDELGLGDGRNAVLRRAA